MVEKMGEEDVLKELYHTKHIRHLVVPEHRSLKFRPEVYAAVSVVRIDKSDVDCFRLGYWIFGEDWIDPPWRPPSDSIKYDAEIVKIIVPRIRGSYRNVGKIIVGSSTEGYIVHCARDSADAGRIEIFTPSTFPTTKAPPKSLIPPSPLSGYIMPDRINIHLYRWSDEEILADAWRSALLDPMRPDILLERAYFGNLPINIDDLTQIYRGRTGSGIPRLWSILSEAFGPWTVDQFSTFAGVASVSLTDLRLTQGDHELKFLSIRELPKLVSIIRKKLPSLRTLCMDMDGDEGAEDFLFQSLSPDCLAAMGRVQRLKLSIRSHVNPDQDVITRLGLLTMARIVYRMCGRGASVNFGHYSSGSAALQYYQNLSRDRKAYMATIDMQSIGVRDDYHLKQLRYREDGSPIPIWESRLESWEEQGEKLGNMLPELGAGLVGYAEAAADAAKRVRSLASAGEEVGAPLEEAKALLEALRGAKEVVKKASELLGGTDTAEREIKEYIGLLEGQQAN